MAAEADYDIFIIGGGINGCGIARDAAGRNYVTGLAEMGDLASGTSSWSTKLIHGGLRYLEHYEFRLVREALAERERLWRTAPHIIRPIRLVLPMQKGLRPSWLVRLGLLLYDHIGGRKRLPATRSLDLTRDPAGLPLRRGFHRAFEFSDCWADDARLVLENAMDAVARGAAIRTRTEVVAARRSGGIWAIELLNRRDGSRQQVTARALVNASGPWVDRVIAGPLGEAGDRPRVRLVQGSHIVVPAKFADPRAYLFQAADGRVIFAIPYEGAFTLIGTTDRDYAGDPAAAEAGADEIGYLCATASAYFAQPVRPQDVVWSFSGVRPLFDDGASKAQEATRDYVLELEGNDAEAPVLHVIGGKLTTYRRLAEAALARLATRLGKRGAPWTANATLPGGDFPAEGFDALVAELEANWPWAGRERLVRLARLYGTHAKKILGDARRPEDLGREFGAGLTAAEVAYLMAEEWAETAEDVLWRRTKLGLQFKSEETDLLVAHMAAAGRVVAA